MAYRCPVCHKPLLKHEYEKALGILGEREQHLRHEKLALQSKLKTAAAATKRARAEGVQAERTRTQRLLAGKEREVQTLKEQLRRLRKGTTPQTDGLEFEDALAMRLQKEFPADQITHRGRSGDILHHVLVDAQAVGLILYECKRCQRIESSHVQQAARDKRDNQADFAILVTTGKRRGFTGLAHEGTVLLVSPLGIIALARLVRNQVLEMARSRLTGSERERVAVGALQYLTSSVFKAPLEDAIAKSKRAADLLRAEIRAHMSCWRDRWELYQTVSVDLTSIADNTVRVAQGVKPAPFAKVKPAPLQLPAGSTIMELGAT